MLREVAGNYIVVPTGKTSHDFNGMINLNETGAFLFKKMQESDVTEADLTTALLGEYDVPQEIASRDAAAFMKKVADARIVI